MVKKLCTLIHTLMTVCSYKTVVKFFPHQAADLELAVGLLEQCEEEVGYLLYHLRMPANLVNLVQVCTFLMYKIRSMQYGRK